MALPLTCDILHLLRHSSRMRCIPKILSRPQHQDTRCLELNPFSSRLDEAKKEFLDELVPPLKRSFNLASYVNSSDTLQELVKLGVSLYDLENVHGKVAKQIVLLDFRNECLPSIKFLVDNGLKEKNLGRFISEYPNLFFVPLDNLKKRVQYLRMKAFSKTQIALALNRSSQILSEEVKTLDHKLGQFQIEFNLPGQLVRNIVTKYPPIISLPSGQYKVINFCLSQEYGFRREEIHQLLENQPSILDLLRPALIDRLELVHNDIGLSHQMICRYPKLLTSPIIEMRQRFLYLEKLKRNQFDPKKPLYVPPSALYNGDDESFCKRYAKTNLNDYKMFVKFI